MNIPARTNWVPSPREQRVLWYLQVLMRYIVGGGGLTYTAIFQKFNPFGLLVFGALATSTDVFGFVRTLIKQARAETLSLEEELKPTGEPPKSGPSSP